VQEAVVRLSVDTSGEEISTTSSAPKQRHPLKGRHTPIGILRLSVGSIWAMSEWGKESQTIVLFEVSARGVRKLTSADVSGC
jgi:hypothetical protein